MPPEGLPGGVVQQETASVSPCARRYRCPFCIFLRDGHDQISHEDDLVFQDHLVTAFIAPYWWPNNPEHVLVIPNTRYENISELPRSYGHRIQDVAQAIALAFKRVYQCHGVSTVQHNEPAGNQEVWHYHLHVVPRYTGDNLYRSSRGQEIEPPDQRRAYAEQVKRFLREHPLPAE
ncbi:MAG: HIT family protein [Nitrososphaerota archaeon]